MPLLSDRNVSETTNSDRVCISSSPPTSHSAPKHNKTDRARHISCPAHCNFSRWSQAKILICRYMFLGASKF
ncbi:hypothetical protein L596_004396 [Steinernema carpocapsae]|uniref:Uncharacterized protein n=1 Tax=Steinernema carpocapsae TaxID=34508 RepID=A0A4V6YSX5_STECR|nr:hypothetical protein L596_004396 [Steinernema carpocapsae]